MAEQQVKKKRLKSFFIESKRVLKLTKKPNREEFMSVVKITGLGILVVGLMGFIIQMAAYYITH